MKRDHDQDAFFRGITLRICSSLDIEVALRKCIDYLKEFMPLVAMNLALFNDDNGTLQVIAHVTLEGESRLDHTIQLPPEAHPTLEELRQRRILINNHPEKDPLLNHILKTVGQPERSIITMYLELEGEWLGMLTVIAEGNDRYVPEHARLVSLLHEPFAIAMSNAMRYRRILELKNELADDNQYLQQELRRVTGYEFIGADGGLKTVMNQVIQVADTDSPVLLLGETGAGKEVIANHIHYRSRRKQGPFIRVNCGAIPETLIDSELFGHEKGAFTGAVSRKRGRFERARGGTIFLDEIGDLPLSAQTRLLRVIQNKEFERVGGTETLPVDIRIIAATHQDLVEMAEKDSFRKDLWFRLNVFPITIPSLRERPEDIPELIDFFVKKKSVELNLQFSPKVGPSVVDRLTGYHWPGNVRELENAVEHALILHKGRPESEPLSMATFAFLNPGVRKAVSHGSSDEILPMDQMVFRHIQNALNAAGGKIHGSGGAAELLGMKPTTLRYRMEKLGIPFKKIRTGK